MKGVEKVFSKDKLVAVIYRSNIPVKGVKFLTGDGNPLQVGIHQREKGVRLSPHIHKLDNPITINSIQEILYVVEGKIKVTLYNDKGIVLKTKLLGRGDSILFVSGGHGVDFLESSRIFEVKQGPYPGVTHAKIFLK